MRLLVSFLLVSFLAFSVSAFSQDNATASISPTPVVVSAPATIQMPPAQIDPKVDVIFDTFVYPALKYVTSMPKIGPVLTTVFSIMGTIAVILTFLVVIVRFLFTIPEIALRYAGKKDAADKILVIADKVVYWLKKFSMFNAQKK